MVIIDVLSMRNLLYHFKKGGCSKNKQFFLPGHCWSLHAWVWVKSSVEDSQPVKHDLDLIFSQVVSAVNRSTVDQSQVDQSLHDDSCIPFCNISRAVINSIFDMTYNLLRCKYRFESDHLKWQENMFHQYKFYFWSFLHFHRLYYNQNMIPMPSILKPF